MEYLPSILSDAAGEHASDSICHSIRQHLPQRLLRQYVHFCTSKASKLRTRRPYSPHSVAF